MLQDQKKLIDERNKTIKLLQERIKALEKRIESEIGIKELTVKQFKTQLDAQSQQIANLTYQLHLASKFKPSAEIMETSISPMPMKRRSQKNIQESQTSVSNFAEPVPSSTQKTSVTTARNKQSARKSSASSVRSNWSDNFENEMQNEILNSNRQARISSAASVCSEGSETPLVFQKVLPPVIKRLSENVPPPDPKPFLLSAASTLHTRNKKDIVQRRTLISLPPIKPFDINQLAIESPYKATHNNSHSNKIVEDHSSHQSS